jgi:hypothetical protein
VVTPLHQLAPCSYASPSRCSFAERGHLSSLLSPRTDVLGCRHATFHGVGCHVRARSSSSRRVLPCLLQVQPPRLYRLRAWPLTTIAVPADYTIISVHYDFVVSVIASSSTTLARLLRQPQTASVPLFAALRLTTVLEPPLLVSLTCHEVHTGPILRMLGAGNTAVCLLPAMSPDLATPVWHLAYGIFDNIIFGIDTLSNDCLDRVQYMMCTHVDTYAASYQRSSEEVLKYQETWHWPIKKYHNFHNALYLNALYYIMVYFNRKPPQCIKSCIYI